jgi:predicted small metal-binding protein
MQNIIFCIIINYIMIKTFTCKELGGTCDQKFSGTTFMEIVEQAMPHMMSDETHKANIMDMEKSTGENQDQWMARMQKEFDVKAED